MGGFGRLKGFVQLCCLTHAAKASGGGQPGLLFTHHITEHTELTVAKTINREDIGEQCTLDPGLLLEIQQTIESGQLINHWAGRA